jgi:hypothetical protein
MGETHAHLQYLSALGVVERRPDGYALADAAARIDRVWPL